MHDQNPAFTTRLLQPQEWLAACSGFLDFSYQQHPAYVEESAAPMRASTEYVGVYDDSDKFVGGAAVRIKKLPFLGVGVAYVGRGPVAAAPAGSEPSSAYCACLSALSELYVSGRGLTLRVAPPDFFAISSDNLQAVHEKSGFSPTGTSARQTIMVPLDKDLAALRKALNGKWRNKLSQAEKAGITVEVSRDPSDIDLLDKLLTDLEARKGFHASQDASFFRRVQEHSPPSSRLWLYVGRKEGRPVSAHLCDMSGTVAISILAATNDEGRDLKVSHVMQWQVIQDCLTLGKNFYDTGGIDRAANPGVHLFKSGMGGFESTSAPTVERKPDTAVGRMTSLLESAYGLAKSRGYRR